MVDDHPVIAKACRTVLDSTEFGYLGAASDTESAHVAFLEHKPDVVIVDLALHGNKLGGIALIERSAHIIVTLKSWCLACTPQLTASSQAIEAGATGYLIKDSLTDELKKAIQQG